VSRAGQPQGSRQRSGEGSWWRGGVGCWPGRHGRRGGGWTGRLGWWWRGGEVQQPPGDGQRAQCHQDRKPDPPAAPSAPLHPAASFARHHVPVAPTSMTANQRQRRRVARPASRWDRHRAWVDLARRPMTAGMAIDGAAACGIAVCQAHGQAGVTLDVPEAVTCSPILLPNWRRSSPRRPRRSSSCAPPTPHLRRGPPRQGPSRWLHRASAGRTCAPRPPISRRDSLASAGAREPMRAEMCASFAPVSRRSAAWASTPVTSGRRRRRLRSWCDSGGKPRRRRNGVRPAVRASSGRCWGGPGCRLPPRRA
jgi:hypothetical protein